MGAKNWLADMTGNTDRSSSVVVVDDEEINLELLNNCLETDYSVTTFDHGKKLNDELEALTETDLFLLDIRMPDIEGYELCKTLKNNPKTAHIPVIFVSALDETEDVLKGYECGCDDYIKKPFEADEVLGKVETHLERSKRLKRFRDSQSESTAEADFSVVKSSLNQIFEMAKIISFYENCFNYSNTEEVGRGLLATLDQLYLEAVVQVRSRYRVVTLGADENSLESKLIEKYSKASNKHVHIGGRSIYRKNNIVILVKNMPVTEEEKYGRYKDHIQTLISSASQKIATLDNIQEQEEGKFSRISSTLESCQTEFDGIEKMLTLQRQESNDLFNELLASLEDMLFTLGLEEDQEKALISLVERNGEKLEEQSEKNRGLLSNFSLNFKRITDHIMKI